MSGFAFGPFELDPVRRRLVAGGEPVALSDRQVDILLLLVARAGHVVAKDDLLEAGWKDVAVGDNSLEQAISSLRRTLGAAGGAAAYIETVPRRGYRFSAPVERRTSREPVAALDVLLAPHRAFLEGQAALETLEGDRVARALEVFDRAVQTVPEYAAAHIGLANACVMRFEMTRADAAPDASALVRAEHHAREACRLDPQSAEAWATLGFVLGRIASDDALAAAKRAIALEPDNWRHHFRLANVAWGEERLRAAHRTLKLLPGFPLAHWLAATVYVARQVFDEAERELDAGIASDAARGGDPRFGGVALHWLAGLVRLAHGDDRAALEHFERELTLQRAGHLYGRECCANTWYAIGAVHLLHGDPGQASAAFDRALDLIPAHPLAVAALQGLTEVRHMSDRGRTPVGHVSDGGRTEVGHMSDIGRTPVGPRSDISPTSVPIDRAVVRAIVGDHAGAAQIVDDALVTAQPGNAGWLLPVEPVLRPLAHPEAWARPLARLRHRAA